MIKPLTVRSVQEDEALSLKVCSVHSRLRSHRLYSPETVAVRRAQELCARFVMKDLRNR